MNSLSANDHYIFNKLCRRKASSYLLDYVTREFEAIISCPKNITPMTPPSDYFSSKQQSYFDKTRSTFNHSGLPSPPLSSSPEKMTCIKDTTTPSFMPLRSFIEAVMRKSRIDTGTLLSSLCYARRLKLKLFNTSKGMECTHHRIFLATLIIATKYIHDSAIKNKYWVQYSCGLFSGTEINLMEKQLLQLLDYNLEIPLPDYEILMNDIVQLRFQHKMQIQCPTPCSEVIDWYPTKQQYGDYSYADTTPITTLQPLNHVKPSPPTAHP